MSQQQITIATQAAIRIWQESESPLSYTEFVLSMKRAGKLWGAKEVL